MTFNHEVDEEVSVTMEHMVKELLKDCGELRARATPAAEVLFDVRETTKLGEDESKFFHSKVAQALYLSKRVRPDCLTAVAFLTTRVAAPDINDTAKLRRVLGYVHATWDRGITLRIGDTMQVRAYIDAAYGVHQDSGKSHTGCVIVLGTGGPLFT